MEPLAGDDLLPYPLVSFPDHLSPFPEAADFANLTSEPHPPDTSRRSVPPLQKLRPVRCSEGRRPSEVSELKGALLIGKSVLGSPTPVSAETENICLTGNRYTASSPGVCIGSDGNICAASEPPAIPRRMRSEFDSECASLISEAPDLDAEFSSPSDEDCQSSDTIKEHFSRKRKRKQRKRLEHYFENAMKRMIDRQEQMYDTMMEIMENKERERIAWEEAWRQQNIERAQRNQEVRAQEIARSLALIAFIENFLGSEVQLSGSLQNLAHLGKIDCEILSEEDIISDSSNKRWPKSEVQALITVRTALHHMPCMRSNGNLWEEVADVMAKMGYTRTPGNYKEKWKNINKYYKRTVGSRKDDLANCKSCPYFNELDILHKGNSPTSGSGYSIKETTEEGCTKENNEVVA